MKGYSRWNFRPYTPYDLMEDAPTPVICAIAPGEHTIRLEWLDATHEGTVFYAERSSRQWCRQPVHGPGIRLENLKAGCDYQLYIENAAHRKSRVRLARTGSVPGTVVNFLHPEDDAYAFSGRYLCSPSLIRLPGGRLLASMDVFGPAMPQNLTLLFSSEDDGATWDYRTELFPCFWGKLFLHRGSLYMLGASTEYGDVLIGKSDDEGLTWSEPAVIVRGSGNSAERGFHKAPVPVIRAGGRLWSAVEYGAWGGRRPGFCDCVLSIDENRDLLKAENWTLSRPLPSNPRWENAEAGCHAIEGNLVTAPDGSVCDILRYAENKALLLQADPLHPDRPLQFRRFLSFPMGHTKFEIRREGDLYVAVGNRPPMRNVLSVYTSRDLESWEFRRDVVNCGQMDPNQTAFQYPSFLLEGNTLLVLSRTAFNRAHSYHDSNYITFHRVRL